MIPDIEMLRGTMRGSCVTRHPRCLMARLLAEEFALKGFTCFGQSLIRRELNNPTTELATRPTCLKWESRPELYNQKGGSCFEEWKVITCTFVRSEMLASPA